MLHHSRNVGSRSKKSTPVSDDAHVNYIIITERAMIEEARAAGRVEKVFVCREGSLQILHPTPLVF